MEGNARRWLSKVRAARGPRRCVVAALLLVHAGLLGWGAARHSPTVNELGHLCAGLYSLQVGRFELYRVNPPLVRMIASFPVAVFCSPKTEWRAFQRNPDARLEMSVGTDFANRNGPAALAYVTIARWACIPLSVLGACICYRWAGELYGSAAGVMALTMWCFSPNILAHGQLITSDMGATSFGIVAAYAYWRWLKEPRGRTAAVAGLALGLAALTKTTWVVLFGLWPLLWLASVAAEGTLFRVASWRRRAGQLGAILLLGVGTLNLGYGFRGSFERLGQFRFTSDTLIGPGSLETLHSDVRNRFVGTWMEYLPVPVPADYVLGIDAQMHDFEMGGPSYLRGEWKLRGWWYYYLYALAVKVPLGTWVLVLLALLADALWFRRLSAFNDRLILIVFPSILLALVSSQTGFSHHLRYVLPVLPFMFIWTSQIALAATREHGKTACVAGAALLWSVGSSLAVYPHSLSYFNELAGGPSGGHAHLLNSNIDWGQDLLFLKQWLDRHPEARPLRLAFHGGFDPRIVGIDYVLPEVSPDCTLGDRPDRVDEYGPRPGWYAASLNMIYEPGKRYAYLSRFEPVATAGYSIRIYYITRSAANRQRREFGLPEL